MHGAHICLNISVEAEGRHEQSKTQTTVVEYMEQKHVNITFHHHYTIDSW